MESNPALSAAIDAAYDAFSRYPRPDRLDASSTEKASATFAMLTAAPLRKLTAEQIGPYSGSAIYTIGGVTDYKHFLPRILELAIVRAPWIGTEPEIIASRLNYAEWRDWPKLERSALQGVFHSAWRCAMPQHPDTGADAESWFCALAKLAEPVETLLFEWLEDARNAKLVQLADFVRKLDVISALDYRSQIYWHDVDAQVRANIIAFLISTPVRSALAAADGLTDEDDLWRVQLAEQVITDFASAGRH